MRPTGLLADTSREALRTYIPWHGRQVVFGVSQQVAYVVLGSEAGKQKLAQASKLPIPLLEVSGLPQMVEQGA